MTDFYLAESLQEVSPELVMEASLPLRRKKSYNWLAFAACFALVTICSFTLNNLGMGGASMGADSAAPEMESVTEGVMDGSADNSSANNDKGEYSYDYVVCNTRSWELVNFDLAEMNTHADTIVIGEYSGAFDVQSIDGVTVHFYEFTVKNCAKGKAADNITVRLPVLHAVQGSVEEEQYDITVPETEFFDPTEDGQVMLFLKDCGNGVYRKAQEPFTFAINPEGIVTVRSNLLLPHQEREILSTTRTLTENGKILLYIDDLLRSVDSPVKESISGMHINDILEILGSDLRILY